MRIEEPRIEGELGAARGNERSILSVREVVDRVEMTLEPHADVTAQLIMIRIGVWSVVLGDCMDSCIENSIVDVHKLGSTTSAKKLADASGKWNFDLGNPLSLLPIQLCCHQFYYPFQPSPLLLLPS